MDIQGSVEQEEYEAGPHGLAPHAQCRYSSVCPNSELSNHLDRLSVVPHSGGSSSGPQRSGFQTRKDTSATSTFFHASAAVEHVELGMIAPSGKAETSEN